MASIINFVKFSVKNFIRPRISGIDATLYIEWLNPLTRNTPQFRSEFLKLWPENVTDQILQKTILSYISYFNSNLVDHTVFQAIMHKHDEAIENDANNNKNDSSRCSAQAANSDAASSSPLRVALADKSSSAVVISSLATPLLTASLNSPPVASLSLSSNGSVDLSAASSHASIRKRILQGDQIGTQWVLQCKEYQELWTTSPQSMVHIPCSEVHCLKSEVQSPNSKVQST